MKGCIVIFAAVLLSASVASLQVTKQPWSTVVPSTAVRYGPNQCVSVYRDAQGHCVMHTECENVDTATYDFGMVCVNDGVPVRHLFGKNSFESVETFNTLIKCDKCIGLDGMSATVRLRGIVTSLTKEVEGLKTEMLNMTADLTKLRGKVLPAAAAPPKAAGNASGNATGNASKAEAKPAEATPEVPAEEATALVHHGLRRSVHRPQHHKHAAKKAPRSHHGHRNHHHRAVVEDDEDNEQANELEAEDVQMEDEREYEEATRRHKKRHARTHKKRHHRHHHEDEEEEQDEEAHADQSQEDTEQPQESAASHSKELQAFHAMDKDDSGAVTKAEWMSSVSIVKEQASNVTKPMAVPKAKEEVPAVHVAQKEVEDLD